MKVFELTNDYDIDHLKLVDRPDPKPGPGQVLLKMKAWSLNYRDILVLKGRYITKPALPFVPLSDGVGEVAAVGEGVTRVILGDRVAPIFMQKWIEGEPNLEKAASALGANLPGIAAEYVVLDAEGVVHVPGHLTNEEGACLPCAGVTAWHAVCSSANLKPSDIALTQGTGGVSLFSLQFAKTRGTRVVITSSSDAKLARVRELGAWEVINYVTTPEWGITAGELTDGVGVDHVVELGGAGTLVQSLRAVRMGGQISLIGILTGSGQADPTPILMKSIKVNGIFVGSRVMFEDMNRAISTHELRPIIDRVFPFNDLPAALHYMESGKHFGKIAVSA